MQIKARDKVEDCFDGSSVYRYSFDEAWTRETIGELKALGRLEYFPDFPRPFFRVITSAGAQIKGVEGENDCQVVFPRRDKESEMNAFENLFTA